MTTPRPWAIDPDDRTGYEWNFHIVEAANPNRRVCFMTSTGPSEENAALIVRAVNKIDALESWIKDSYSMWLKGDLDPAHMRRGKELLEELS